jgi:hypothetical protein
MLGPDQVTDSLHAYQLAKRGNSLRVMAEAVRWGKRGARVNTISPGIIFTPLAKDELTGPRGAGYRRMLELSPVGRGGTPDEVATVGALLMGPDGACTPASQTSSDRPAASPLGRHPLIRSRTDPGSHSSHSRPATAAASSRWRHNGNQPSSLLRDLAHTHPAASESARRPPTPASPLRQRAAPAAS